MHSSPLMAFLDYKRNFMEGCGNEGFHVGEQVEVYLQQIYVTQRIYLKQVLHLIDGERCGLYGV